MSNRNFNKQVVPARTKLSAGGSLPKRPTKKPNTIEKKILDPRTREQLKERFSKKKYAPEFKKNSILIPKKIPKTPRPTPLTPKQQKKLKDMLDKKQGRKKLMGGGSSSSREAMMHGFYNKDMGMGKKKK